MDIVYSYMHFKYTCTVVVVDTLILNNVGQLSCIDREVSGSSPAVGGIFFYF